MVSDEQPEETERHPIGTMTDRLEAALKEVADAAEEANCPGVVSVGYRSEEGPSIHLWAGGHPYRVMEVIDQMQLKMSQHFKQLVEEQDEESSS